MSSVRDLIKGSLRLLGVIAVGETPSADEQADALIVLNEMMDSWSTESLAVYSEIREEFSVSAGQSSRTMGPSGDFDTSRPLKVLRAGVMSTDAEIPIDVINQDQWADIVFKDTSGASPSKIYLEGTSPLETINIWPVPSASITLVLYSWKPLTAFTNLSATVDLPPGYAKALRYNLALELSAEYGVMPSAGVAAGALESKENIRRINSKPHYMDASQPAGTSRFNIYTGE